MIRTFAVVLALLPFVANAQPTSSNDLLDPPTRAAIVEQVAKLLRTQYIYPDVGVQLANRIQTELMSGAYNSIRDSDELAKRLTADMAAVAHDKHLEVMVDPGGSPSADNTVGFRSEFGVVRADRLAGNIGYLEVSGFVPPLGVFEAAINRAMASLSGTRALIIDIRRNYGGDPDGVAYFVSFFADGERPVHIEDIISRNPDSLTFKTNSFFSVRTPTIYLGRPVLLLTSHDTFSGAEAFAYEMQALKFGIVVGETTGGGAHPVNTTPLAKGLIIAVPIGRSVSGVTHGDWEGRGVTPDVLVPSGDALAVAQQRLGEPAAAKSIDELSRARLFEPRTTEQSGAGRALRRFILGVARGAPPYKEMTTEWASETRENLAELRKTLSPLGTVKALSFVKVDGVGGNLYNVQFVHGEQSWIVVLASDGKVATAFSP